MQCNVLLITYPSKTFCDVHLLCVIVVSTSYFTGIGDFDSMLLDTLDNNYIFTPATVEELSEPLGDMPITPPTSDDSLFYDSVTNGFTDKPSYNNYTISHTESQGNG